VAVARDNVVSLFMIIQISLCRSPRNNAQVQ
jgi:hypothetical protein